MTRIDILKIAVIDLEAWLGALYAEKHGLKHGDSHADFVSAIKADPALLRAARARHAALEGVVSSRVGEDGGNRRAACIISETHHKALTLALAEAE